MKGKYSSKNREYLGDGHYKVFYRGKKEHPTAWLIMHESQIVMGDKAMKEFDEGLEKALLIQKK